MSGLISPTTRTSMSRSPGLVSRGSLTRRSPGTSPLPGSARRCEGARMLAPRPAGAVDQLGEAPEAVAAGRREERVPGRRVERRRPLPHGAAGEDAARAGPAGDLDLGLERRVVDAAREQHPRHPRRRVELVARFPPARRVDDGCVVRELGLEDVAADRRQPPGGLDHDLATRLAGQLLAVGERERERLDEQREIDRPAGGRDLADEPPPGRRRSTPPGGSRRGASPPTRP